MIKKIANSKRLFLLFFALNALLPIGFLLFPKAFGTEQTSGIILSFHQAAISWTGAFLLFRVRDKITAHLKALMIALTAVGMGDLTYGWMTWVWHLPASGGYQALVHEIPYSLFALFAGLSAIGRMTVGLKNRLERLLVFSISSLFALAFFYCSYHFVISPFYHDQVDRPEVLYTLCLVYAAGQSMMIGGGVVSTFRSKSFLEFCLWSGFSLLVGSDFALRYRDIGGTVPPIGLFDIGWHLSLILMSVPAAVLSLSKPARMEIAFPSPANIFSLRVISAVISLSTLFLFIISVWKAGSFFGVSAAGTLSFYLVTLVVAWAFANLAAISVARYLEYCSAGGRLETKSRSE
jgi:hypothetical protein